MAYKSDDVAEQSVYPEDLHYPDKVCAQYISVN